MAGLSVIQFDLRRSPECPDSQEERYRACLDMVRWADENGITVAGFSEHHNTEDGYLSAPLGLAGMMTSVTSRVRISVSALLVPLHEPMRLAEEISLLDRVSGGRFSATCGLGYREIEYQALGVDWARRGKVAGCCDGLKPCLLEGEHGARHMVGMGHHDNGCVFPASFEHLVCFIDCIADCVDEFNTCRVQSDNWSHFLQPRIFGFASRFAG